MEASTSSTMMWWEWSGESPQVHSHHIIVDDVVGMVRRFAAGPTVDEEHIAYDLIEEIGPIPGSFMTSELTMETYREECYDPTVASRFRPGSPTVNMVDKAAAEMEKILSKPIPSLTNTQEDAIEQILQEARNHYYKQGFITKEQWDLYQKDLASDNYPFG